MGVVRDVTVDNLVTAVGNIDTSSLAQDNTLQDVVTAIGNISGGSDPVTNTTVNSLCKDTTGQNIASAISGLGQLLGADKANIDGSNIADKAAFRQNIDINKVFYASGSNVSNLNDCKAGGFYRADRNTTNTPTISYHIVMVIVFRENIDLVQVAIDIKFAKVYVRSFHDGSTWTAWMRCDNV